MFDKTLALNRRCAWEMITEINTRLLRADINFDEVLFSDCLKELEQFVHKARLIGKKTPVSPIEQRGLGKSIMTLLKETIYPFIQKWRNDFLFYWKHQGKNRENPFLCQKAYPKYSLFLEEWQALQEEIDEYYISVFLPCISDKE